MSLLDHYRDILAGYKTAVLDDVKEKLFGDINPTSDKFKNIVLGEDLNANIEDDTQELSTIYFKENIQDTFKIELLKNATADMKDIGDFILAVENLEAKYTDEEVKDVRYMVTQIRKNFSQYNTSGWDKYLIPNAKNIKLKHENKEIEKLQNIKLPDGSGIDIGHLFTGLDSLYNKSSVSYGGVKFIDNNYDATTWVGDFGAALEKLVDKYIYIKQPYNIAILEQIIQEEAGAYDLLGDIDAFVIFKFIAELPKTINLKISNILRLFYIHPLGRNAIENRFKIFVEFLGLDWIYEKIWLYDNQKSRGLDAFLFNLKKEERELFNFYYKSISSAAGLVSVIKVKGTYIWTESLPKMEKYFSVSRVVNPLSESILYTFLLELSKK